MYWGRPKRDRAFAVLDDSGVALGGSIRESAAAAATAAAAVDVAPSVAAAVTKTKPDQNQLKYIYKQTEENIIPSTRVLAALLTCATRCFALLLVLLFSYRFSPFRPGLSFSGGVCDRGDQQRGDVRGYPGEGWHRHGG